MKTVQTYTPSKNYHKDENITVADEPVKVVEVEEENENESQIQVQRAIRFFTGIIAAILGLRFILALFGANPANGFVSFVYDLTSPLVAPFNGLFNAETAMAGGVRFEADTLFAILIYTLIGLALVKLVDLFKAKKREES